MHSSDAPFALRDESERERRLKLLDAAHIAPLTKYLLDVRLKQGNQYNLPAFDPCDGGIHAKLLFLLEAPGPKAVGSTFISRNNPDQTARNMNDLLNNADIRRSDTLLWNIVPWYIGDGRRIRSARSADIRSALPYLRELIHKLHQLRAIILVGKRAQSAANEIRLITDIPMEFSPHPSPRVFNVYPEKKREAQIVFSRLSRYLR